MEQQRRRPSFPLMAIATCISLCRVCLQHGPLLAHHPAQGRSHSSSGAPAAMHLLLSGPAHATTACQQQAFPRRRTRTTLPVGLSKACSTIVSWWENPKLPSHQPAASSQGRHSLPQRRSYLALFAVCAPAAAPFARAKRRPLAPHRRLLPSSPAIGETCWGRARSCFARAGRGRGRGGCGDG